MPSFDSSEASVSEESDLNDILRTGVVTIGDIRKCFCCVLWRNKELTSFYTILDRSFFAK